jgi:hypothetical protein
MRQGLKASANTYTVAYKFVDLFGNVLVTPSSSRSKNSDHYH